MIEVKQTDKANYQFIVKSETGKTLLSSIPFDSKTEIDKTISSLTLKERPLKFFERKTNFEGKFLFSLKNDEGKTIGNSGFYTSEAGMENGIKNLRNRLKTSTSFEKL